MIESYTINIVFIKLKATVEPMILLPCYLHQKVDAVLFSGS